MKRYFILTAFIIIFFQGCIPLNNVHEIKHYEIKEGKPKARKDKKKYTRYIFTNNSPHQIVIRFLEDKYHKKSYENWFYSTSQKLFLDVDVEFTLNFMLYSKQQRYLDLYNLFKGTRKNDPYYNKELDDPYQEGQKFRYVSIVIKDEKGEDCLSKNSPYRDRLILYLKELKREYEIYKSNYNFINGR